MKKQNRTKQKAASLAITELNEKPKENALKLNFSAKGNAGTFITSNVVSNDYINELNGIDAQKIYYKMTVSDSQIRKLIHAVNNPIKSATWDVPPISDSPIDIEAAALVSEALFSDLDTDWISKLDEILTFPWQGHAVFEVVYENKFNPNIGLYTGLKSLSFRAQDTLTEWIHEKSGALKSIKQVVTGDLELEVEIPKSSLLIFYNEKKGSDTGFPFCRMLYGNWKRKNLYKELQAIGIERASINTPILKVPDGINPNTPAYQEAISFLSMYTQAQNSYFVVPQGWELTLTSTTFNPANIQTGIKAENEEIVGSLVGMFLEMGLGGNSGNQAGTEVSANFFVKGLQYLADKICNTINREIIPNLVRANLGDKVEVMPKLVATGISEESGKMLMEIVTGYTNAGVITKDELLEDHVRKVHKLPKKLEGSITDNQITQKANPTTKTKKENVDDENVEMNDKVKLPKSVSKLMEQSADKINQVILDSSRFIGEKYIADVTNRYKQLSADKKLKALDNVKVGGRTKFRKALEAEFENVIQKGIDQVLLELNLKDVKLSEKDIDESELKFNDTAFPAWIAILLQKQAQLIEEDTTNKMISNLGFAFTSIATKSDSESIIKQNMLEELDSYLSKVEIKGDDVSALLINEARFSVFESDDVNDNIHSYTFMNDNPKTEICTYCTGKTFLATDAESLRYSPPLHHRCKSFLRANLKTSKGLEKLKITTLNPSASAVKGITL